MGESTNECIMVTRPPQFKHLTVEVGVTTPGEEYALQYFEDLPQDKNWKHRAVSARQLWLHIQDLTAYVTQLRQKKIVHSPPKLFSKFN